MSYDEKVYSNNCVTRGHLITSVQQEVEDPKTHQIMRIWETFCSTCGMSLETIRTMKEKRTRRPRKVTAVAPQ